ncbi:MAG: hypothetical protein AAGE98_12460 [Actinomycetota bacterium]
MARRLIVTAVVLVVAAACAEQAYTYDPDEVEARVAEAVAPEGVDGVGCGDLDTIDPDVGGARACNGVLDDDLVDISVTLTPTAALDGLDLDVEILTEFFDVAAAAAAGSERLDAELGGSPVITCPVDAVVLVPRREITCRVVAEGGTAGPVDRPVTIVIVGDDGSFELDLFE